MIMATLTLSHEKSSPVVICEMATVMEMMVVARAEVIMEAGITAMEIIEVEIMEIEVESEQEVLIIV